MLTDKVDIIAHKVDTNDKVDFDRQGWWWPTRFTLTNKVDTDRQVWYQQIRLISTAKVDTDRQGLHLQTRLILTDKVYTVDKVNISRSY